MTKIRSKEQFLNELRSHPQNCIYIFMGEQAARKLNRPIVTQKREQQLKWTAMYATQYGVTAKEVLNTLDEGCRQIYGLSGKNAMSKIMAGKQLIAKKSAVTGMQGIGSLKVATCEISPKYGLPMEVVKNATLHQIGFVNISGIGATDASSALDALLSNTQNGIPTTLTTTDGQTFSTTINQDTGNANMYNLNDGSFLGYFDQMLGYWKGSDGQFIDFEDSDNTVWDIVCRAVYTLATLLEMIASMLNIKQPSEFSAMQTDGWYTPFDEQQASTLKKGNTAAIVVGIVILALFLKRK